MNAIAEKIEVVAKIEPLDPARITQAEFSRCQFVVNLPVGYPYAELLNSEAWKRIARTGKLGLGDEIVVRTDDLSLWAHLLVVESVAVHANIRVVELLKRDGLAGIVQDEGVDEVFEIKHLGMNDLWGVVHKADGKVLVKNLKSRDHAKDHLNTMRPAPVGGRR